MPTVRYCGLSSAMTRSPNARRAVSATAPSSSISGGKVQPSMTRVQRTPSCELRTHRPALDLVALEQLRPGPALMHGGELPAQIHDVADAGVHAKPAERREQVR